MPLRQVDPDNYPRMLAAKAAQVAVRFAELAAPEPEVYPSPPLHYRMRAEFRVWHQNGEAFCAMFAADDPKIPVRIDEFPIACEGISRRLRPLMASINASDELKRRLFQLELLSTKAGDTLLTLIYHRPLQEQWIRAAQALGQELGLHVIGRSRKQKLVLERDYVEEQLQADGRRLHYRQYEGGFTQPNAAVNEKMLDWACARAGECTGDLLELYCGNGNFTVPLSRHFARVLATEVSKTSVKAARENCALNAVDNVEIVRMSSEEITAALRGARAFRRLRDIDLADFDLRTVFVDPPRAGLDPATRELVSGFAQILYISCNPQTLLRDVAALAGSHAIARFALFDQFPYTDHMECGMLLEAR